MVEARENCNLKSCLAAGTVPGTRAASHGVKAQVSPWRNLMNYSKYLAGLLVLAVSATAVQAGPPRRSRWNSGYSPLPQSTSWVMGGSQRVSGSVGTTMTTSPYFVPTAVPTESSVPDSSATVVARDTLSSDLPVAGADGAGVTPGVQDALAEVNATRAQRGLQPYLPDPLLNQAARACAIQRATRMIQGHLPESDFSHLPPGAHASAAGCGALTPDWGWGSCCTYDSYTYAGAAWVMGQDGRRYMHLFVR